MAQQIINVGTAPNDGLGDPIRTAYIKCNDNFGELFSRAQPNPPATLVGAVGDQAGMYAYDASYFYYCYADYDGSSQIWAQVTQVGNVVVNTITNGDSNVTIANLDGNITVAVNGVANVAVFTPTGVTVSGRLSTVGNIAATGTISTGTNISATGNIIGAYHIGNGSQLTGIISSYGNSNVATYLTSYTGNIAANNVTASTSLKSNGNISATGNIITSGYFVGNFAGNVVANIVVPGSNTQVLFNTNGNADAVAGLTFDTNGPNLLTVLGDISSQGNVISGNVLPLGDVSAVGNITGAYILGNGSQLTGLPAQYSNANVAAYLPTYTGNITGGNLSLTGNIVGSNIAGSNLSLTGNIVGSNISITGNTVNSGNINALGNVYVTNTIFGNVYRGNVLSIAGQSSNTWLFQGNVLTSPSGGSWVSEPNQTDEYIYTGLDGFFNIVSLYANAAIGSSLHLEHGAAQLNLSDGSTGNSTWSFAINGSLTTPGNINPGTSNVYNLGNSTNQWANITAQYFVGNGSQLTGLPAGYANSNVAAYLPTYSGNIAAGNVLVTGVVSATGNITGSYLFGNGSQITGLPAGYSNADVAAYLPTYTGNVQLGNIINAGANGVGNIGSSSKYFNTVFAKATSAQYADLAENYLADSNYPAGTVMCFDGEAEVTQCNLDMCVTVAGVVSTQPAYQMNTGLTGETVVALALMGRVPCNVIGTVQKGDMMVSAGNGRARAEKSPAMGSVIGKAVQSFNGNIGTIEIVVGRL